MTRDIRWKQRLQNFDRAVALLGEPVERGLGTLSDLEKEGVVQRFEVAVELAWKTLKDFLEQQGMPAEPATPRQVFKDAFNAGILADGQVWIDMLHHRNLLSHTYDSAAVDNAMTALGERYFPALVALRARLAEGRA